MLFWKEDNPVQVTSNLHLPHYVLTGFETIFGCTSRTNTGEYSCARVYLSFEREFYPIWTSIYVPSILIHILSWIPFWFVDESNDDKSSDDEEKEKKSKDKKKRSKDKSGKKRMMVSLTALVLIIWFSVTINPVDSGTNYKCNRQSMWIGFIVLMNFISFIHVCWLEKGGKCNYFSFAGKKKSANMETRNDLENIPLNVSYQ